MTNVGSEPIMLRPISPRSNTWLIIWSERRPASTHSASDARPPLGMTTSLRASSQRDFFTRFPWRAQPSVAQIEPAPDHQPEIGAEQDVAEQRAADAQMGGDGAAEIAGQQDGAEHGSSREGIEDRRDEGQDAERARQARRDAELGRRLDDDIQRDQLDGAVEQQEDDDQAAQDAPGPD